MARPRDGRVYIGTSGWSYEWWRETFYPPGLSREKWLPYYASSFKTVEVNYSFYRLPGKRTLEKWRDSVENDFVFAVKGSRYITHYIKLKDAATAWGKFHDAASALGDKLGPILFEFPAAWPKNADRLAGFLEILPPERRFAFEFRHSSWFDHEILEILNGKGASLVTSDSPTFPRSFEETGTFSFIRLHGGRVLYGSEYSEEELAFWARRITEMAGRGRDVYAYFNNDAHGNAPKNAIQLINFIGRASDRRASGHR